MNKYSCIQKGCDFITQDIIEAENHLQENDEDHIVIEILKTNNDIKCRKLVY